MTTHQGPGSRATDISDAERELRVELAAFYRMVAYLGWDELIFSHISLRLPGEAKQFLINPFGMLYEEISASSLIRIDLEGNALSQSDYPVNKAGFVIHSAIHEAREDAHCVIHVHTTAGMAVAQQREGLLPTNFYSASLYDNVSYHDFEGSVVSADEKVRLAQNLGRNNVLILRNHGLLVCGPDVASTFTTMYTLQRACEVQISAQAGGPLIPVSKEVRNAHSIALNQAVKDAPRNDLSLLHQLTFDAMKRRIDRLDSSYRD